MSRFVMTPLCATERLKEIGEEYDRKEARVYYGVLLLIAIVLGLLFELRPVFLLVILLVYIFCVPRLVYNHKKFIYETKRFNDINAYMSQMAQSFLYTQDVIKSLEETATCFTKGRMHETLEEALVIIDAGKWDIRKAESDALNFIESRYDCERLRNLHIFFLDTEKLGGECQKEFRILEHMRIAWQNVVESIRVKKIWDRNIGAIIYAFFLIVCIIMLHIMRSSDLDIVNHLATQLIDMFLLVGFVLYFVFMDRRLTYSLLVNPNAMSEEEAKAYFEYLENYDSNKERRKYRVFAVLSMVIAGLLIYTKSTFVTVTFAIVIVFAAFNVHTMIHVSAVQTMKREIAKAFPRWLFDIMLLLQSESVEGAIEKSIPTAPPVLKAELIRITDMLAEKPHDPDAYMSFLRDFNDQGINEIMHKLYSLAVGANRDSEVLDVVMEKNMKNLEKSERDSLLLKDNMKSLTWVPFLCVGFGCMGYLVIAITTSINGIIHLIR